jgi:hypothetical protein
VALYRFLRAEQFDLVEVSTPKAALPGSLAAWAARTKCLVHVLLGASYEGTQGLLNQIDVWQAQANEYRVLAAPLTK